MDSRIVLALAVLFSAGISSAQQSSTVIGVPEELARGAEALRSGDFDRGVRLTQSGLTQETNQRNRAAALSNLCAGFHGLKRFDEALEACRRSLLINRYNWRAWHNLALTHIGLDQLERAREELESALVLMPESTRLSELLGRVEEELLPQSRIIFEESPQH